MVVLLLIASKRIRSIITVLIQAINLVAAIITIATAAVVIAATTWLSQQGVTIAPFASFVLGGIFSLTVMGYVYAKSSPVRSLLRGYRWVRAEYVYRIDDTEQQHHTQTIEIQIEAMRPQVDHFENRYLWSGSGQEDVPKVISDGHSLMGPPIRRRIWNYYYVHLGHEFTVGERQNVKIVQQLYDTNKSYEPFLAKIILEPVDYLTLRAILPRNRPPITAYHIEHSSSFPEYNVVEQGKLNFDTVNWELRWDIPSPTLNHRYEIRWSW